MWAFVGLEAGIACVVAGWVLCGQRFSAWLNAGFAVGFVVTWVVVGRVRQRRGIAWTLLAARFRLCDTALARPGSQVVRHGTANPVFAGSIPAPASEFVQVRISHSARAA